MTLSDIIPGVSEAKAIAGGVMVAGVVGFGLWGARVNHLRAEHLTALHVEQQAHALDIANWKAASAKAQAADAAHARQVEQQQAQIAQDAEHDLQTQLADARSIAARWMQQHTAPANDHSSGGNAAMPDIANATRDANLASAQAIVSGADIDACTTDFVIAQGWQQWWSKVQPVWASGATK